MIDWEWLRALGVRVGEWIQWFANQIVDEHWPGLLSLVFLIVTVLIAVVIWAQSRSYVSVLKHAKIAALRAADDKSFDPESLSSSLANMRGGAARRLATAFKEFRETLLETGRRDDVIVRNSIRPAAFINVDDLGFSLKGWRFLPGTIVSLGLLLTFLGLVAVLSTTSDILPDGQETDQKAVMEALRNLLGKASAKFTISLSALACSIALNLVQRVCASRVEHHAAELTNELERRLHFVSLEGLADRQLGAIENQTASMKELITTMTAELSKPLAAVTQTSMDQISAMVDQLGTSMTSGIGSALDKVSERIEAVGEVLAGASAGLDAAAQQFDGAIKSATEKLEKSVSHLTEVAANLTDASGQLSENLPVLRGTIEASNAHAMKVSEGAATLISSIRDSVVEERRTVTETTEAIRSLIRSFEARAAAYDGQLEKAFRTYQDELTKAIDLLENHGRETSSRFAEGLSTLQAVIENAKAFEPESQPESGPEAAAI
ncbi:MAG: hypothetical protein R3D56_13525 [Paracoccaceae bacterium]